jgi:hypothetical protein
MKDRLDKYLKNIVADYGKWTFVKKQPGEDEVKDKMFKEFADGLTIEDSPKRKWIRIVTDRNGINRSVHSFIVKNDCVANGKSWRKGDILKAASWNAPALNKPRGNIFDSKYSVAWTGATYLISTGFDHYAIYDSI